MKRRALGIGIMATLVFALSTIHFAGSEGHLPPWTYSGKNGPAHWGDLSPEYILCKTGKNQSPIDITKTVISSLPEIGFQYSPSPVKVVNNGKTIQINFARGGTIRLGNETYSLVLMHFHAPGEHFYGGKPFDMEAHLVHQSSDGRFAVVSVMMKSGALNTMIQTIWDRLSKVEGREVALDGILIDAGQFLPADHSYYHYSGSLTTPPCTEGVSWNLLKTPVEVSPDQIVKFKSLIKISDRPVQPLNGRTVGETAK